MEIKNYFVIAVKDKKVILEKITLTDENQNSFEDYCIDFLKEIQQEFENIHIPCIILDELEFKSLEATILLGNDQISMVPNLKAELQKLVINCSTCVDYGNASGSQKCSECKNYNKHRQ